MNPMILYLCDLSVTIVRLLIKLILITCLRFVCFYVRKIYDTVAKLSSSSKAQRTAASMTDQNIDRNVENSLRNENDSKDSNINSDAIAVSQTIDMAVNGENISSTSSFEAREREITEQVKRQVKILFCCILTVYGIKILVSLTLCRYCKINQNAKKIKHACITLIILYN